MILIKHIQKDIFEMENPLATTFIELNGKMKRKKTLLRDLLQVPLKAPAILKLQNVTCFTCMMELLQRLNVS